MPIYMHVDGVNGDVTAEGHDAWIEVDGFEWTVGRKQLNQRDVRGRLVDASVPEVSEICVSKALDRATPGLLRDALWGEGKLVRFNFCKTDKGSLEPYFQVELENALVSDFSIASGGDRPTEKVALNFTKFTLANTGMTETNAAAQPERLSYDMARFAVN